ncbi:MAG: hypothetical protein K2X03_08160 [Bryobacteraceae bacterium]|nr:hypothetical protein [Bryobacteraceae bacterium]
MVFSELYLQLGESQLIPLLRTISLGKLKTFQMFDRLKTRLHLTKLNNESLKKIAPKVWQRLGNQEEALGQDLAQSILVSNLDMIKAVLDFLGVPHEDGFFAKDLDAKQYLTGDWQQKVYAEFRGKYPDALLAFYVNHLAFELLEPAVFVPMPPA